MLDEYTTILNGAEAELIEKKSRFIATVRPVKDENEAKAFIAEMRKKYWDATHNVFAYQIGERNEIQRSSDDGEPQGTAYLVSTTSTCMSFNFITPNSLRPTW